MWGVDFSDGPAWDWALFRWLNRPWPGGDVAMWWTSHSLTWVPLYLLLLGMLRVRLGSWARWGWAVAGITLCLAGTDMLSARLAKPTFERLRPSHTPALQDDLHLVTPPGAAEPYRGGSYGFVSSHAANHMGIAVFVGGLLGGGVWLWGLVVWAVVIGYSRVYLGVHFPFDVLGGFLLGAGWGGGVTWVWRRFHVEQRAGR
ncbi:MAG: hypothetical protein RJA19_89 [Bacteroidota bacterium]|jgi:undecaprenyl-diphosphatase